MRLPADYVAQFVRLGYAATIDSAQGITADSCHVALTGGESRQQLYVAMTRGIHANHAYIPTALNGEEGSFWTDAAAFPRTAVEGLVQILARDGAQKSAHTQLRDVLDPRARLGRAIDIYLDSLGVAAENALGADGLARIDAAAEAMHTHLTDSPAYPVLRQHLATIAVSGREPVATLHAAANARELDTADDPAAVLDWRLDSTGMHSTGTGPLPWIRGIPTGLDSDHTQVAARARIVAELADQISLDVEQWAPATAAPWARALLGIDTVLLADLAVWRAGLHVHETDPRPTGPPRYSGLEREHQHHLDRQVETALGDITRPVHQWADTIAAIEPRILADPYWPVIADRIDIAACSGIDVAMQLSHAAALRPLPDEMPAAALWSRLDLQVPGPATGIMPEYGPSSNDPMPAPTADRIAKPVTDVEQQGALTDADSAIEAALDDLDIEQLVARHSTAQTAIRTACDADEQFRAAARALHATRSELTTHREKLDTTPARKFRTRHALQTRIDELITEQVSLEREHTQSREHARRTHNNAVVDAGPPENWQRKIDTTIDQVEADARETGRLQRHRRNVTPEYQDYAEAISQAVLDADGDTGIDSAPDEPVPWSSPDVDLGL
ncbi:C-terminal helicase domain-containing protein [Nocardia noduli]|uniref:C-terminal helicase domain-containing protein n=1 Tax=Nocardia noduli TaxID=2815722 RepID=UPI001C2138A4|nr:helicase C-terminal domain-containing protein [Nocardia noduli]